MALRFCSRLEGLHADLHRRLDLAFPFQARCLYCGIMNAETYLQERQILWALRRGLKLVSGSTGKAKRQRATRTPTLEDNLLEPLTDDARREYDEADGQEARARGHAPKMHSVYSSSALVANTCAYWRRLGDFRPLARALKIPSSGIVSLDFEQKLPICDDVDRRTFPHDPNLDVVIRYGTRHHPMMIGVEGKFTEAYPGDHQGLKSAYLEQSPLWTGLPNCRRLAESICPTDTDYSHLDASQLLKHILGLRHACGGSLGFRLVYLWYDVPFCAGAEHHQEIQHFAEIVAGDGIKFQSITYQDVILGLAQGQRREHGAYVDYMVERYL